MDYVKHTSAENIVSLEASIAFALVALSGLGASVFLLGFTLACLLLRAAATQKGVS